MFKNIYIQIIISLVFLGTIEAQHIWYENSSNTNYLKFVSATKGTFTINEPNPDINDINLNTTVSKFVRDGQDNPRILFNLNKPITDFTSHTTSLKARTSIPTSDLNTTNKRIRLYLRNSSIGPTSNIFVQQQFTEGETWESFTFDFDGLTIPSDVSSAGGYDQLLIFLASGDETGLTSTYHIDAISGNSEQKISRADPFSGNWGVRFNLNGGFRLDSTDHYDWIAGAQQIVDNLPAVDHVMTNFTHPARGYLYTLRDNPYVDVVNEIHPGMVPSVENEQIILEIIDILKKSGKKIILYINGAGPAVIRGEGIDAEIGAAWEKYYTANFAGDEGLAWRTLAKGYFERFEGLVDGYWIDNLSSFPGNLSDFVAMIREVDPDAAIATNLTKSNILDADGNEIFVDADSSNDEDPSDYRVFFLEANDPYMDFTAGHPTPLGQGAPPNSWAYEEFSFPLVAETPWSSYDGSQQTLKHFFAPIRERWSVADSDLVFEAEQAYRFVRTFTDPGAAITWSTTITDGFITNDEMAVMLDLNDRMLQTPKPDYEPYVRPEGAYLVGEAILSTSTFNLFNKSDVTFYPNPVLGDLTITREITDLNYLTVVNALGTKVMDRKWDNGSKTTQLDLSNLNSGIYYIKLSNARNHSITQKIIIAK